MTDEEDNLASGQSVSDDKSQERNSWPCLVHYCSRSLTVVLSQFFAILLFLFACFSRIYLPKTCEESNV